VPEVGEFPLRIGVTTHAPVYEQKDPVPVKRYRVRADPYEVTLVYPGFNKVVGTCSVRKIGRESFVVRPRFAIEYPAKAVRFWGGFSVDDSGTATLENVYLVPVRGR
jgi:hypothetical protein